MREEQTVGGDLHVIVAYGAMREASIVHQERAQPCSSMAQYMQCLRSKQVTTPRHTRLRLINNLLALLQDLFEDLLDNLALISDVKSGLLGADLGQAALDAVSYTHLTLPTKRIV